MSQDFQSLKPLSSGWGAVTERQRQAMLYIQRYVAENGRSPTYDEIRVGLNLRSRTGGFNAVKRLASRGYLALTSGKERAIQVLEPIIEGHFFVFDDETKSLKPVIRESYTPPKRSKEPPLKRRGWTNYEPSKKSIRRGAHRAAEAKRAAKAVVTLASVSLLKGAGAR